MAPSYQLVVVRAADSRAHILVNVCDPTNAIVKNLLQTSIDLWVRAGATAKGVRSRGFRSRTMYAVKKEYTDSTRKLRTVEYLKQVE